MAKQVPELSAGLGEGSVGWKGQQDKEMLLMTGVGVSAGKFSPTAWGEIRWQKRALKRMSVSGKVTQTRYCRGRLGCIL